MRKAGFPPAISRWGGNGPRKLPAHNRVFHGPSLFSSFGDSSSPQSFSGVICVIEPATGSCSAIPVTWERMLGVAPIGPDDNPWQRSAERWKP